MTPPVKLVDEVLAPASKPKDDDHTELQAKLKVIIEEYRTQVRAEARREFEDTCKAERKSTMEDAAAMSQDARSKAAQVKAEALQVRAEATHPEIGPFAQSLKTPNITEAVSAVDDAKIAAGPCHCLRIIPGDPARFDGGHHNQEAVDSFVDGMESIFFFEPRLTEVQVVLATTKFQPDGAAAKWVRPYMKLCRAEDPKAPEWIRTWPTFSAMLSAKFGESQQVETTMTELRELRQAYTARLYSLRFTILAERIELPEEVKKAMFKLGLKSEVRAALEGRNCATLNDLIKASIAIDEELPQNGESASPATTKSVQKSDAYGNPSWSVQFYR